MKKSIILLFLMMLLPMGVMAQSSMTDDQIFQFIIKEHETGASQQQIVIQLMQRGVDINQIRRVKKKYERLSKQEGLGTLSNDTDPSGDRTRNKAKKSQMLDGQYDSRIADYSQDQNRYNSGNYIG